MANEAFQIERVGKVSGNIVEFGSAAQQYPEENKQQNRKPILLPVYILNLKFPVSEMKKENKDKSNDKDIQQDDNSFEVFGKPKFLHSIKKKKLKIRNFFITIIKPSFYSRFDSMFLRA